MDWIMDQFGSPKTRSCYFLHPQILREEQIFKGMGEKRMNAGWIWLPDETIAQNIQEGVVAKEEDVPRYAPSSEVLEMGKAKALGW